MMRRAPRYAALLIVISLVAGCGDSGGNSPAQRTAAQVERLRTDPARLADLLRRMPKGADLHSHLTGAARTESLIDWGIEAGRCVDDTFMARTGPCGPGTVPMRDAETDPDLYMDILGAWSMEGFVGPVLARHAHFFDTFGKFGAAVGVHTPDIFVEQKREAARDRISYLEIMSSFGSASVAAIGTDHLPQEDEWSVDYLVAARNALLADPRFGAALDMAASFIDASFEQADRTLHCGTPTAEPACAVELRALVTANRILPRAAVFAQFLYGFELAQRDPRVVGVNLVGPEEDPNSLQLYDDEMLAVGTLRELYASGGALRPVPVSLHAGELIPELLPDTPDGQRQLTFHIRRAVEVGGARRIGHGIDLEHEHESNRETPDTLLATMRQRGVLVEISLTSEEVLLGVEGPTHPLDMYLTQGVPVALSTDDEGILRTDLTEQYVRAVVVQGLDYFTLQRFARNALEYSFAPGASLWRGTELYRRVVPQCAGSRRPGLGEPSPECARYLAENLRAALQWRLEEELFAFERSQSDFSP